MTATLVAILSLTVFGIPFVLALDRDARPLRVVGLAFLYGSGVAYLVMLAMAVAHIRWTLVSVTVAMLVVWMGCSFFVLRSSSRRATNNGRTTNNEQRTTKTLVFDLLTLTTLAGYAIYATIAPLWEWDFWAIWGLKARVFIESGTIDWRFLESRWNAFVHPDYPLLVTLNDDFVALLGGGWSDRWLGLLCVAWAVALLFVVRELALRETTPLVASIITFGLSALAVSRYVGLAEGALIAFGGAGVLFIRRALFFDDDVDWRHGAICLGFAACCKNEGLAMFATVVVLVAILRRTRAIRLWPAIVIAAPWLVLRVVHHLQNDIAGGSLTTRLLSRLDNVLDIVRALALDLFQPLFWVAILVAILVIPAAARRREAFVLFFTAIQAAIYAGAYLVTPHDPRWHIVTSWPRLTGQISVPIAYALMVVLANSIRRAEDSPHAEARPQQ